MRWYKRDPNAALQGMAILTLEECGAYNKILDLLYARDGHLPDQEREISRLLHCDLRVWRRVRRRLMDLGKLYIHGGNLRNARADDEINYALARIAKTKAAGLLGAETRRQQRRTSVELLANPRQEVSPKLVPFFRKLNDLR